MAVSELSGKTENTVKKGKVRYLILLMLFLVTSLNYGDRAVLSIAGSPMAEELNINPVAMGYIFSAFAWAYVLGQIPGGWLLDKYGSKKVYFYSIFFWSLFTLLQGFVYLLGDAGALFGISSAVVGLFFLRFIVGIAECPAFPGNSRIVASWFPTRERGTASAVFNSASYFATVIFAPLMGWFTHEHGWHSAFIFMGLIGIVISFIWLKVVYNPKDHPRVTQEELEYIEREGALVNIDGPTGGVKTTNGHARKISVGMLLKNKMLVGVYAGQYCITTLTWFFLTWFPIYLIKEKHMTILTAGFVAVLPALCGFGGGILGGFFSDYLIQRGHSLTFARKTPIILGMICSMSMVLCNYLDSIAAVVFFMSLSFFGKGFGALGWVVISDTSPKEAVGLSGGLFNTIGNVAGIITPIVIGYIVQTTGSFNGALVFVCTFAVLAILSYLLLVGEIKRVEV